MAVGLTVVCWVVVELIVSAINNLKSTAGGHHVHKEQAILSTMVVSSHTFSMGMRRKLTSRGAGQ